jgi:signal transduction histidine kinase
LEAREDEALPETLERLRAEAAELRASRERLVLDADADRRRIERELHEGVQQHLVALAVNLQLAVRAAASDPAAVMPLLRELESDVQRALDEAADLAQSIYPTLLEAGGVAAMLRSAAATAGVPASIEVGSGSMPPEVARTVYLCWRHVLEHHRGQTRATLTAHQAEGALRFEVTGDAARSQAGFERLRDRVEALGGRLTAGPKPGGGIRVAGSLPLSRRN